MAVTVNVYTGVIHSAIYGAIQKTNTVDLATRSPFFVTLRSVGVETFNANENYTAILQTAPFPQSLGIELRQPNTGSYNTAGNNELATGNGYTKGGQFLTNPRVAYSSGTLTLQADDVKWAATGTGISAKSALLCYELPRGRTFNNDPYTTSCALAMIDFDGTKYAPAGSSFILQWPAAGILKWQLA